MVLLVDFACGLCVSEEVSLAVVASGVSHVDALRVGFDADCDDSETERSGERDGRECDAPARRVVFGVVYESAGEAKLIEAVLGDVIDLALAVDRAQHGPNACLAQIAKCARDSTRRACDERV